MRMLKDYKLWIGIAIWIGIRATIHFIALGHATPMDNPFVFTPVSMVFFMAFNMAYDWLKRRRRERGHAMMVESTQVAAPVLGAILTAISGLVSIKVKERNRKDERVRDDMREAAAMFRSYAEKREMMQEYMVEPKRTTTAPTSQPYIAEEWFPFPPPEEPKPEAPPELPSAPETDETVAQVSEVLTTAEVTQKVLQKREIPLIDLERDACVRRATQDALKYFATPFADAMSQQHGTGMPSFHTKGYWIKRNAFIAARAEWYVEHNKHMHDTGPGLKSPDVDADFRKLEQWHTEWEQDPDKGAYRRTMRLTPEEQAKKEADEFFTNYDSMYLMSYTHARSEYYLRHTDYIRDRRRYLERGRAVDEPTPEEWRDAWVKGREEEEYQRDKARRIAQAHTNLSNQGLVLPHPDPKNANKMYL